MKITVIGASAGVGLESVKRALERNHIVTTLSRSEIALPSNSRLKAIKGSALNKTDLKKSIDGAEAIIVALGTGSSLKDIKKTTLYSDFAKLLVEIDNENPLLIPVIVLTGFGAGDSYSHLSLMGKIFFNLLLKVVYADKTKMEEILTSTKIKWEIVRPGQLLDKPLTEKYRVETKLYKGINIGGINRADVADYLIKQAENPTELFQYVSLSNK